jgi:hypothetical protein
VTDEEVVRAAWDAEEFQTGSGYSGAQGRKPKPQPTYWFVKIRLKYSWEDDLYFSAPTLDLALSAAAEFTRDRQEEIRQLREEIKELDEWNGTWDEYLSSRYPIRLGTVIGMIRGFRTSARLEAILTDLKKGMK